MNVRARIKIRASELSLKARFAASAVLAVMLTACGGGLGGDVASLPGTGGTGITAMGPVAGFGSVIVNGIRFEDSAAKVLIDGQEQSAGDTSQLRLGVVANVVGRKSNASVTTSAVIRAQGTADRIEVWSIAQGTVTNKASSTTFSVAGMNMVVDAGTVFEGAMSTSSLNTSTIVKVWGLPITADFSQWSVTRLEVLDKASSTISTGKVVLRGSLPTLNGLALAVSGTTLADGQLVRAVGNLTAGTLTVSKITALDNNGSTTPATGYAEIEGIVTSIVSSNTATPAKVTRMTLGATTVDTTEALILPAGASLASGKRVEVRGNWSNGILLATQVSVRSANESQEVEIQAAIEQFTSIASFIVRGQRCDASGLALTPLQISKLGVNVLVHLEGRKNGDVVRVTELEIKSR
ncbi:MAG: DUF5666 domain-containing protein [Burkholderiaceae bacterium]